MYVDAKSGVRAAADSLASAVRATADSLASALSDVEQRNVPRWVAVDEQRPALDERRKDSKQQ